MGGENIWPRTAWKLQWARVLIHWKVMQLKVALRINCQPDKNRIVTQKKQISALFPPQEWLNIVMSSMSSTIVPSMHKTNYCSLWNRGHLKYNYMILLQMPTLKLHKHFWKVGSSTLKYLSQGYQTGYCIYKAYLSVYMTLPLLHSLRRRFGVVIQWASDLREFLKNVSGIQILPTMLLLSMSSFIELLNFNRLSYHVWAKKMSMVYSCNTVHANTASIK